MGAKPGSDRIGTAYVKKDYLRMKTQNHSILCCNPFDRQSPRAFYENPILTWYNKNCSFVVNVKLRFLHSPNCLFSFSTATDVCPQSGDSQHAESPAWPCTRSHLLPSPHSSQCDLRTQDVWMGANLQGKAI